jgi:hypothetical protein
MEDWNAISAEEIKSLKGSALLKKHGGVLKLLITAYPHYDWSNTNLEINSSKREIGVLRTLKQLFPGEYLHPTNYSVCDMSHCIDL